MALTGFVHLTHPATGGEQLAPDDASVVEHWTARGWVVSPEVPAHLDPDAPDTGTPAAVEAPFVPVPGPLDETPAAPAEAALEAPAPVGGDQGDGEQAPESPAPPAKTPKSAAPAAEQTGE